MPRRIYSKPIASFEYGTRVYAPTESKPSYRVIAKDPDGKRIFLRFPTEDEARRRAREIETSLASSVTLPGRGNAPITVGQLMDRYLASLGSRSTRYVERQEYLLRCWVRPVLDDHPLRAWTPADSDQVLDQARASLAPATVQNLGAAMRALVTFAFKNRWLPREADPMWKVQYTPKPEHQGEATGFVPRDDLPTDAQCAALFEALADQGHPDWALAMRLKHRSGLRWGELIALRPCDLTFSPKRSIAVVRAVEQSRTGFAIKTTKNRQRRQTIFPASLRDDLAAWCDQRPSDALLFAGTDDGFANRRTVQRFWARAAKAAGWPMRGPMSSIWHPHDLRHVAACWMLFDVGLEAPTVSAMLGHANTAFTLSRYVSVRGDLAATATAATDSW
jgi:integrase